MTFNTGLLAPVKNPSNSILIEQNFSNVDNVFKELISIAKRLPRTKEIINHKHYWKGVCRSFFFRFPDDLEILQLQQEGNNDDYSGIIQIKSYSLNKRVKDLILKPNVYGFTFTSLIISCIFIPQIVISRNIVDVNEINDFVTYGIIED